MARSFSSSLPMSSEPRVRTGRTFSLSVSSSANSTRTGSSSAGSTAGVDRRGVRRRGSGRLAGAGVAAAGGRAGRARPPIPTPFSSAIFARIESRESREISLSVSKTPTPWMAAASKWGAPPGLRVVLQRLDGEDVAQVALVVLEDGGHPARVEAQLLEVLAQVRERLLVGLGGRRLAVRHEHDAVDALQHQPPRGVVEDLAGDGVELQADLHPADDAHVEGQEVEEERAVRLGLEAHHLAARARGGLAVDPLEVRGLPAEAGTVVHDLGRHLHRGVVHEDHGREEV